MTASIQSRRGSSPPHSVWSQSPPVIHVPAGTVGGERRDARDELRRRRASRSCTEARRKPPSTKCTCASMKPGTRNCPPVDDHRAAGRRRMSAVVPTAAIRSPAMATASAAGAPGCRSDTAVGKGACVRARDLRKGSTIRHCSPRTERRREQLQGPATDVCASANFIARQTYGRGWRVQQDAGGAADTYLGPLESNAIRIRAIRALRTSFHCSSSR